MNPILYPNKKILPWDKEEIDNLTEKSFSHDYKKEKGDIRDSKESFNSALTGLGCEFGFPDMFSKKWEERIIFKSINEGREKDIWTSPIDLIIKDDNDKEISIDIKGSSTLTGMTSPALVNFVLSRAVGLHKTRYGSFPDYYVQMFWDMEKERVYYVGALSGKLVEDYVTGKKTPEFRGASKIRLIMQKDWDATNTFRNLIDKKYKFE